MVEHWAGNNEKMGSNASHGGSCLPANHHRASRDYPRWFQADRTELDLVSLIIDPRVP